MALALPGFHDLTGCDTVTASWGHGKKSAWATRNSIPDLTDSLVTLTSTPVNIQDYTMHCIERFVGLSQSSMAVPVHIRKLTRPETNSLPRQTPSNESNLSTALWNNMWIDHSTRVAMSGGRSWSHNPWFLHKQAGAGGKQKIVPTSRYGIHSLRLQKAAKNWMHLCSESDIVCNGCGSLCTMCPCMTEVKSSPLKMNANNIISRFFFFITKLSMQSILQFYLTVNFLFIV